MSVALLPVLLVVGLLIALVVAVVPRGTHHAATDVVTTSPAALTRARRHAAVVAAAAWSVLVAGLVALPLTAPGAESLPLVSGLVVAAGPTVPAGTSFGITLGLVPALAGLAFLLVAAVGERTWPMPQGAVRRASLVRRTGVATAPRVPLVALVTAAGALLLVLLTTALTAAPDGRSVTFRLSDVASSGAGPYPGPPYAVPLAAGAVLVVIGTLGVLHLVARRPAVTDVAPADDATLRTASAGRVVAGALLVVGGTLTGVLLVTGSALRHAAVTTYGVGGVTTTVRDTLAISLGTTSLVAALLVGIATLVLTSSSLGRASRAVRATTDVA